MGTVEWHRVGGWKWLSLMRIWEFKNTIKEISKRRMFGCGGCFVSSLCSGPAMCLVWSARWMSQPLHSWASSSWENPRDWSKVQGGATRYSDFTLILCSALLTWNSEGDIVVWRAILKV
jgi:hypothetical protein